MLRHIFRNILAVAVLLCCTTSCCVADWYHDLVYGNEPPPITPIAPAPGGNVTAAYTPREIVTMATDSLIFFFVSSGIRKPAVACFIPQDTDLETATIGRSIFFDLRENKAVASAPEKFEYLLEFARREGNMFWVGLRKGDTAGSFLFTAQYKIREVK